MLDERFEGKRGEKTAPSPAVGACQAGNVLDAVAAEAVLDVATRRSLGIARVPLRAPPPIPGKAVAKPASRLTRIVDVGAMVFG